MGEKKHCNESKWLTHDQTSAITLQPSHPLNNPLVPDSIATVAHKPIQNSNEFLRAAKKMTTTQLHPSKLKNLISSFHHRRNIQRWRSQLAMPMSQFYVASKLFFRTENFGVMVSPNLFFSFLLAVGLIQRSFLVNFDWEKKKKGDKNKT